MASLESNRVQRIAKLAPQEPQKEAFTEETHRDPEIQIKLEALPQLKPEPRFEPKFEPEFEARFEPKFEPKFEPELESADQTPFSDLLPQLRTPKQQERINNTQTQALNGDLGQIANLRNGYAFGYDPRNPLSGECAYFAQQITSLNGQPWTIGSTIREKKQQFANHVKNGNAFYAGDGVAQVGNSIVFNGGKYGHVAVITEIKDGKARLEESNLHNDHKYTNSRWINLSDPTIIGFLGTSVKGAS